MTLDYLHFLMVIMEILTLFCLTLTYHDCVTLIVLTVNVCVFYAFASFS